jgi:hypothetical protein
LIQLDAPSRFPGEGTGFRRCSGITSVLSWARPRFNTASADSERDLAGGGTSRRITVLLANTQNEYQRLSAMPIDMPPARFVTAEPGMSRKPRRW